VPLADAATSNRSSLDTSLQRHASFLFDATSFEHFVQRKKSQTLQGSESDQSSPILIQSASDSSSDDVNVTINVLHLNEDEFPDVCVRCEHCTNSVRSAIKAHTATHIKDSDLASAFVQSAEAELMKYLNRREERCFDADEHRGTGHG